MKNNKKFTAIPPKVVSEESRVQFIEGYKDHSGAIDSKTEKNVVDNSVLPWKNVNVRDDVYKLYGVRLQEEYVIKIKYIAALTGKPQQKIARDIMYKGINEIISKLAQER
jgi:hypothetical protein